METALIQKNKVKAICTSIQNVVEKRLQNGASLDHVTMILERLKTTTWKNDKKICQFIDELDTKIKGNKALINEGIQLSWQLGKAQ